MEEKTNQNGQGCASQSSNELKEQIGTLLLVLQKPLNQEQQKEYWALFESKMRQYVDLKICEGKQGGL